MKFFNVLKFELLKISSRKYLWIFLILMIIANLFVCNNFYMDKTTPHDKIADLFEEYKKNPEEITDLYERFKKENIEIDRANSKATFSGGEIVDKTLLPGLYGENLQQDATIFYFFGKYLKRNSDYEANIQKFINAAKNNLVAYDASGVSKKAVTYQTQKRVIKIYDVIKKLPIKMEYNEAWEMYFGYNHINLFLFFMVLLFSVEVFAAEKNSGFDKILFTTRNGRIMTAVAKLTTTLIVNAILLLIFTIPTLLLFHFTYGLSDITQYIQSVPTFLTCPLPLKIYEFLGFLFSVKWVVFSAFSMFILCFSAAFRKYSIIYTAGIGFWAVNYFISQREYLNPYSFLKNFNFITMTYSRYYVNHVEQFGHSVQHRDFDIFSKAVSETALIYIIFVSIIIILAVLSIFLFLRKKTPLATKDKTRGLNLSAKIKKLFNNTGEFIKIKLFKLHKRRYTMNISLTEFYKTLFAKKYLLLLLVLIGFRLFLSFESYKKNESYPERAYKEYNETLQGELTPEKGEYIQAERNRITKELSEADLAKTKYENQEIEAEDYLKYIKAGFAAQARNKNLERIETRYEYLKQAEEEKGIKVCFLYDSAWEKLFTADLDIIFYIIVLILFSGIFADEYSEGFSKILKTTKNGRQKTFNAKMLTIFVLTTSIFLIINTVEFILLSNNYGFTMFEAPILSMPIFSATDNGITFLQFLVLFYILKYVGWFCFALLCAYLSELTKGMITTLSIIVVLTLFPKIFTIFGLEIFKTIDFSNILNGSHAYITGTELNLFGNDYGYLIICGILLFAINIFGFLRAEKSFTDNK